MARFRLREGRGASGALVLAILLGAVAAGGAGLDGRDLEQARRLYGQLRAADEEQRSRQCLELAGTLLDYYPGFERNDEVLTLAVTAAARLGDRQHALSLTDELLNEHAASPLLDGALERAAEIAVAAGDSLRAAHYLLLHYDRDPERGQRDDGGPRCSPLLEKLSAAQLADLVLFHPDSALLPWLQCQRVRRLLAVERDADARHVVAELETAAPRDRWTVEALNLIGLQAPAQAAEREGPDGPIRQRQIGVLCPLSGSFADLGTAFAAAARLAVAHANAELDRNFVIEIEDTAGDPVAGALAARRLCVDHGVIALFGDLLSDPTAAAAVVAEQFGTPLVSPTATNDRLWELGANVFQTNLTGLYESRLLARLAVTVLLKPDVAILYPDDAEGRRHADAFGAEVERLGGHVLVRAPFVPDASDLPIALQAVRGRRPEVLFVPAAASQMVQVAPQLQQQAVGALVLGLSSWNSALLSERAGDALEGAVFPDDYPLYPPRWAESFAAAGRPGTPASETDELALQAYQAMRMLLDSLAGSGARTRAELTVALRRRLSRDELDISGPESLAAVLRVMREGRAEPFPASLFVAGWAGGADAGGGARGGPR